MGGEGMVVITDHDEASDARGGGVLHPDDGDREQEVAAVGADVLHAGTEMAAVGAAGGDGLHPDGGLHADGGLHPGGGLHADGGLHPGGGDQIVKPKELMDLPDPMLSEIVKRLPLKEAVATSVLSKRWRSLWQSRRTVAAPNLHIHLHPTAASVSRVLEELHQTVSYDIERFTLILDVLLDKSQLMQFMEFANQRHVKHLHVFGYFARSLRLRSDPPLVDSLDFTLPQANPSLKSLWLQHLSVWRLFCHDGRKPFDSLTSIQLYQVKMTRNTFNRLLNLCPLLRSIDIRYCTLLGFTFFSPEVTSPCPDLNRVIVAHSHGKSILQPAIVPQLDSFLYFNEFIAGGFSLPETAILNDLYICFQKKVSRSPELYDKLCFALPSHLTMLKVLTICTRALKVVLAKFHLTAGYDKLLDLKMLAELQLLVFALDSGDLNHVYAFLGRCKCPNLKRLFVQIDKDEVDDSADDIHEDEPECCFGAVDVAKVANVTWSYNQVKLICFLVKVTKQLNVVSETAAPQHLVGNTEWEQSVDTGKIVITTPDADQLKAFHLEAYIQ